jgi:cysteine desulfuration protein SufE
MIWDGWLDLRIAKAAIYESREPGRTTMTMEDIQNEIIQEMSSRDDWMEKYEYLIGLGKKLKSQDDNLRTEDNAMQGCQSSVWIRAEDIDGRVHFSVDSDSVITKGMLSLLLRVLDKRPPKEIAGADLFFITETGLSTNLSPTRANGLALIVKQMKSHGTEFAAKERTDVHTSK